MSTSSKKIVIQSNGTISYIWSDDIDLSELGDVQVSRASHVEFNNKSKKWEAHTVGGTFIGAFKKRSDAIAAEVKYLEERL